MKLVVAILVTCLAATASAQGTSARCAAYWDAAAVFVGRVESVARQGSGRTAAIAVLQAFRGMSSSRIDVSVVASRRDYCHSLTPGSDYVFYAARGADGAWLVDACGRSRRIDDGAADVEYATSVKSGTAPAGVVTGHVAVAQRTLAGKQTGVIGAAPALTVNLVKDGAVVATARTSGARGWFSLDIPGNGGYQVRLDVPDGLYADEPARDITLADARACVDLTVSLFDDGRVTGRVVDASGRPVPGLTIELTSGGSGRRTVTARDGRYTMARLPAGRYVVSVPSGSGASATRLYHPGVDTASGATRIALAAGERTQLADFRVPEHRRYVAVSGVVLDANGAPAEAARVFLKSGGDDRIVSEPVATDFMGRFVIAARAGVEYSVFAERARGGGRAGGVDATDTHRLVPAEGLPPMRLVLASRY